MAQAGKVYLVGAGPGHPELLTIKAAELIQSGDVIVYDRLIQEEVLALARSSAQRIYMGKPVGRHDSRQDEVNELLVRKAREGNVVVRLKGGDPFLFGRGGEEAEYLADHGIPFEVIPGVCSALSAPLSAGIAVTHREAASAVAIVTGHNADGTESRLDWNALARLDTLVFLMCVHTLDKIAARLIAAGRPPDTPAAIVQMAFWHDESAVTGTLATIANEARQAGVKPPATLVVGEVVRLREKLKNSERDLRRTGHAPGLQPGPAPDELLRLATAGFGAQVLGWALEIGLFDRLEEPQPVCDLAHELGLDSGALNEILQTLVSLRVLESRADGYRNLELASRYLRQHSPQSLRAALLYHAAQFSRWEGLADFARRGKQPADPARHSDLRMQMAECLAAFAAPAVADQLQAPPAGPALIVGWGANAYRDALARCWPGTEVREWNPSRGAAYPEEPGGYGAVIFSGVLEWYGAGELESLLARVRFAPDGVLLCQDTLLPLGVQPPPHVSLRMLALQVANGHSHSWSVNRLIALLQKMGFAAAEGKPVLAGGALVIARPPSRPMAKHKTASAADSSQ
jgi:uroporphyrin-III C-methyltransferase